MLRRCVRLLRLAICAPLIAHHAPHPRRSSYPSRRRFLFTHRQIHTRSSPWSCFVSQWRSNLTCRLTVAAVSVTALSVELIGRLCIPLRRRREESHRVCMVSTSLVCVDWHGILAVLSPLGSYHRLDFGILCGLYTCVLAT